MKCYIHPRHRRKREAWAPPLSASQPLPLEVRRKWPGQRSSLPRHKQSAPQPMQVCYLSGALFALVTCTGCSLHLVLPIPSTVVTATWCKEQMGTRQAVTEKWLKAQIKVIPLSTQVIRGRETLCDAVYHFSSLYIMFLSLLQVSSPLHPRLWARDRRSSPHR